jgi:hypothetical protein
MDFKGNAKDLINSLLARAFNLRLYSTRWQGWDAGGLPKSVWATKGFEFWTFLSLLLHGSGCSRILELGSGRSTITFAEYSIFRNAHFISIETNPEWFEKWRFELRFLHIKPDDNPVILLKTDAATGWYDLEQFRSATGNGAVFDFVLIDGPNDASGDSRGMRDSKVAIAELSACSMGADVIIIDDVHRRHVFESMNQIVDVEQYDTWFYDYSSQLSHSNSLCISTRKSSAANRNMRDIEKVLGIPLYRAFHSERCAED